MAKHTETNDIVVKGAREHNLKNVSLSIPRNKITVFTGLSGSGKSSLAFDTVYAEGQRRYVESLSAYARNFLEQLKNSHALREIPVILQTGSSDANEIKKAYQLGIHSCINKPYTKEEILQEIKTLDFS